MRPRSRRRGGQAQADAEQRLELRDVAAASRGAAPSPCRARAAGLRLPGRSSTNTSAGRTARGARRRARRSPASGLRMPTSPEMHPARRTARRAARGRSPRRPTSSTAARCAARRRSRPDGVEHRLVGAACRRTGGRSAPRPRDAEQRGEARLERPPWPAARLEARPSRLARGRVLPEQSRTVSGGRPSARQNARERLEDVGGEDAAEVDEQPVALIGYPARSASARSAMSGTPCSSRSKNGVLGRARQPPLVGALEEDRGLPQRQRRVPADVGHRAAGARLVASDQLVAGREAGRAGDGRRARRSALSGSPGWAQVATR